MFRQLGLRHLAVLGMDGCLAGILTRKDPCDEVSRGKKKMCQDVPFQKTILMI